MKKQSLWIVVLVSFICLPALSFAMSHGDHSGHKMNHDEHTSHEMNHDEHAGHKMDHGDHDSMSMKGGMIMLGEQEKDGVKANLHMKDVSEKMAEMGMEVTHHFMITLTDAKTGKSLDKGVLGVKITDPSGKEGKATKLMGMQGHFGVDVTLKEKGEYHFQVATKLEDGKTRKFHTSYTR